MDTDSFPIDKVIGRYLFEYNNDIKITSRVDGVSRMSTLWAGTFTFTIRQGLMFTEISSENLFSFKCILLNEEEEKFEPRLFDKCKSITHSSYGNNLHTKYENDSLAFNGRQVTIMIDKIDKEVAREFFTTLYNQIMSHVETKVKV